MPKYWVKNYFAHGRFPEVGQKQKTEKKESAKVGNNNGHLGWRTQSHLGQLDLMEKPYFIKFAHTMHNAYLQS